MHEPFVTRPSCKVEAVKRGLLGSVPDLCESRPPQLLPHWRLPPLCLPQ
jgi:hypothetical protein